MKTIVVVSDDTILTTIFIKNLEHLYNVIAFSGIASALDCIYNSIPDLVIVKIDLNNTAVIDILNNMKEDPIFSQLPVMAVFPANAAMPVWNSFFIEDYIGIPDLERELLPTCIPALNVTRSVAQSPSPHKVRFAA